jgi:hypothetical protein
MNERMKKGNSNADEKAKNEKLFIQLSCVLLDDPYFL